MEQTSHWNMFWNWSPIKISSLDCIQNKQLATGMALISSLDFNLTTGQGGTGGGGRAACGSQLRSLRVCWLFSDLKNIQWSYNPLHLIYIHQQVLLKFVIAFLLFDTLSNNLLSTGMVWWPPPLPLKMQLLWSKTGSMPPEDVFRNGFARKPLKTSDNSSKD